MIRARRWRSVLAGAVAIAAIGACFGQRSADPATADPPLAVARRTALAGRVADAEAALVAVSAALEPALEDGRAGSGRIVSGEEPPGPALREAAGKLESALDDVDRLVATLVRVDGSASRPVDVALEAPLDRSELLSIAEQLRGSADAGDAFAEMRLRARAVVERLDAALAALTEEGDPRAALDEVAEARSGHRALSAWQSGLETLPVWLGTTDELIAAVEALARATIAEDPDAAAVALARFSAVEAEAREADVALDVAIAEGGAAIAAAPLRRLSEAIDRVDRTRQALVSILQSATPAQ